MKMMTNSFVNDQKITQHYWKVVMSFLRKNTYSLNMFGHNTFVFIFRSKKVLAKAEDNFEDNSDGAFPFDSLFEQLVCFNKVLFILGTS